jgi:hypothetical protein
VKQPDGRLAFDPGEKLGCLLDRQGNLVHLAEEEFPRFSETFSDGDVI